MAYCQRKDRAEEKELLRRGAVERRNRIAYSRSHPDEVQSMAHPRRRV
jgi:hypothetical protein